MGKTTLVKKVAHDWAQVVDESVVEKRKGALSKFELALVINLREAATFRNLRDVINCSRIFSAEDSSLTEQFLGYITTNQDWEHFVAAWWPRRVSPKLWLWNLWDIPMRKIVVSL